MNSGNFFAELKRRNFYKVAVAYAVISWLLVQAASILLPTFETPAWVMKALVVLLALGFVFAVMISWAFEMTPQGMKRTENVSPGEVLRFALRREKKNAKRLAKNWASPHCSRARCANKAIGSESSLN